MDSVYTLAYRPKAEVKPAAVVTMNL